MRLLITGGCGFIGCNLIRHIIDQPNIELLVNLDCLTYAGSLENVKDVADRSKYRFEKVDLRDKQSVVEVVQRHDITHIMHLAAESHVDRSITGPGDFIYTNIVGTFNLLEACRNHWFGTTGGIATGDTSSYRFHHVSTDEVYGSLGPTGFFTEETSYAPNSPYSASKAASDHLVRAYHHTYGMPVVITNCSNNYGPYQYPEKLIPVVINKVINREPIPVYGDGLNVRDWLYVVDHADALWAVINKGQDGEVYNIGGHNEWANIKIVQLICDLVDAAAAQLGGISRSLITYVKDRPGHDRRYAIDAGKIQQSLGWLPKETFESGLKKTVDWYLAKMAVDTSKCPR